MVVAECFIVLNYFLNIFILVWSFDVLILKINFNIFINKKDFKT